MSPMSLLVAGSGHNGKVLEESGCTHMGRNATGNVTYLMDLHLSHARAAGETSNQMFSRTLHGHISGGDFPLAFSSFPPFGGVGGGACHLRCE